MAAQLDHAGTAVAQDAEQPDLPSALLRAGNLTILGSGQGSGTAAGIVAELPSLAAESTAGTFAVDAVPMPLAQVEQAWSAPTAPGERIVLTP